MIAALFLVPALSGGCALLIRADALRRALLVGTALFHTALAASTWLDPPAALYGGWLALDAPGRLFLSITSLVFAAAAVYTTGYLPRSRPAEKSPDHDEAPFKAGPEAIFTSCLLFFLSAMSLTCVSGHFGLLWVSVEASTLASAPLIYYHRHQRSLEAMWKYLMICSVGVALALLGNFFLAVSIGTGGAGASLVLSDILAGGNTFHVSWLKAAFLFFLVGYGTKMGLAPFHNWLPDAHSESPSPVSALLSGALLNCAFLGILRALQVCDLANLGDFARPLLGGFGLLSLAVAAVFILRQADFKRMLAYSSVEHMGILALGVGLGGTATFGAMLHALNHSLTKALLFLVAGNILLAYRTKSTEYVCGLRRALPVSGTLWTIGFLAITGSPPFGPFLSEFTILRAAIEQGHIFTAVTYLGLLSLIFVAMATTVLHMTQGSPSSGAPAEATREPWLLIAPPLVLAGIVLVLGVYIPEPLKSTLQEAANALSQGAP